MKPFRTEPALPLLLLIIYAALHLTALTQYPPMHSDEAWLAGLSLEYLQQGTPYVTEPFFDLMPRHPHLIKVLFHCLQIPFITLFGYGLFSVRLMSVAAGTLALLLVYQLLRCEGCSKASAYGATALLAVNPQFLYAARLARQEILMLCVLLGALLLYRQKHPQPHTGLKRAALLIGLSIGIHPNAFIIALMVGAVALTDTLRRRGPLKGLLHYGLILLGFAALFVTLSLAGNPDFFTDYWAYGQTLSVDADASGRLVGLFAFYTKLFHRISGTYYLPDLRLLFVLLPVTAAVAAGSLLRRDRAFDSNPVPGHLAQLAAFNLAIFCIGRYNPTAVLFIVPVGYQLLAWVFDSLPRLKRPMAGAAVLLFCLSVLQLGAEAAPFMGNSYDTYASEIRAALPKDAVVLGNLSAGFALEGVPFRDIRNLAYLNGVSVSDYLQRNGINTLIYYEEYDYIHRNPQWQILYGPDTGYYDDLNALIKKSGTLVRRFESPWYGTRIIRYMGTYPWAVSIYRLDY